MRGMRRSLLGFLTGCVLGIIPAIAQVPDANGKLVIVPGGKGARPAESPSIPNSIDPERFIIIRPKTAGPTSTQPPSHATSNPAKTSEVATSAAAAATGGPTFDYWFAVAIEGKRIGYVRWSAQLVEQKGQTFLLGTRYLRLTLARFGQTVTQWAEESTVETLAGEVMVTSMRQGIGKDQALALGGLVEGNVLKVRGEGAAAGATDTPWVEGVVGLAREPRLFREWDLPPGQQRTFPSYVPTINRVVTMTLTYEGEESRSLWPNTPPRRLRRFVTRPEPLGNIRLPASTTWVDAATGEPLLIETDFPSLGGRLAFLRTTQQAATAPVIEPVEVFQFQSIPLNRAVPGIHQRSQVVYKVTAPRDEEPQTLFAADTRQTVQNFDPKTRSYELHVSAYRGPRPGVQQPPPGPEYTASNYFINKDDPGVQRLAAKAVARLATPTAWAKALAVEKWVHDHMKAFEFSQAMATADQVAKTLSGDCTEYSMLAAAMCRALGIPARTVLGLIYATGKDGRPYLAYHMWFEVYVNDQWVPLDATLGQGGVGPGHLKISDHSWHDEKSFAPLLPVLRTLTARPTVEIIQIRP